MCCCTWRSSGGHTHINLDFMKYKGSLIFGCAYIYVKFLFEPSATSILCVGEDPGKDSSSEGHAGSPWFSFIPNVISTEILLVGFSLLVFVFMVSSSEQLLGRLIL